MYKSPSQVKEKLKTAYLLRAFLWILGQHWRLEAFTYWLDQGMAVPFAKEKAFSISRVDWLIYKVKHNVKPPEVAKK